MKNKKGFTLVELLAVIVILAVLVLIAVPSVINMLDNTRKNAFIVEAENIIKAGKNPYASDLLNGTTTDGCYSLEDLGEYTDKNFEGYTGSVYIDSENNNDRVWLSKDPYIINGSNTGNISVIELEQFNNASTSCQDIAVLACTNYKYTLTVLANDGEFSNGATFMEHEMLTDEVQEIEKPTRTNFVFSEWEVINNPKSFNDGTFTMGSENVTLLAKWSKNAHNLRVYADGGTWNGTNPISVEEGETITLIPPTKSGFVFAGWNITGDGSIINGNDFTMGTVDATLTATWAQEFFLFTSIGEHSLPVPATGRYKLEVWGAQGGGRVNIGGYGGYSTGEILFNKDTIIYINVGESGGTCTYNSALEGPYNGGGGGAYNDYNTNYRGTGGHGGGYVGMKSTNCANNSVCALGGTQTEGGSGNNATGVFGKSGKTTNLGGLNTAGGGGGYYGGGSGLGPGGGGSGYINNPDLSDKAMYCYECEEDLVNEETFTVSTIGTSNLRDTVNCPDGFSTEAISKCAKEGPGYAKITYLGP